MDINGKWKGYYEYGVGYLLPYFGNRVEIEVTFTVDNSEYITGSVSETPSDLSVDAVASLKGFIDESLISFIKTYPVLPEIDENGNVVLKKGTLEIQHTGFIDEEYKAIYGDWIIEDSFVNENGQTEFTDLTGIWFLKKTE